MKRSDERDQSIERLLRQSFKAPPHGVTDSCLDAETLAAWMDGGLSGAALELAQSHVADCARCQSLVGALARTHAIVPQPEPAPRRWLAWLVPLTAAAAAVALWVAVPRDGAAPVPPATVAQEQTAAAKAPEPKLAEPPPMATSANSAQTPDAKRDAANTDQAKASELRKDAGRFEDRLKRESEVAGQIASSGAADGAAAAPAAPAPAAAPAERLSAQARSGNSLAEMTAVGVSIVSPDPAIRWRIAGAVLEHSANGGSSWDVVPTGIATALTAGAAPSPSVCWVVGRAGVVLLSTDGRSFSRVAFPEMTDLSAVRATDARSASVTTMDGRTFSTSDGGVAWTSR